MSNWDPGKHPRAPKGPSGGQFESAPGSGSSSYIQKVVADHKAAIKRERKMTALEKRLSKVVARGYQK